MKPNFIFYLFLILVSCNKNNIESSESIQFIPPDAAIIINHQDYSEFSEVAKNQSFLKNHKYNAVVKFWSLKQWQDVIQMPDQFILTYNILGKNKIVQTLISKNIDTSDIKIKSKLNYTYNQSEIKTFETKTQEFFMVNLAENSIISTSKVILENIVRNYKNSIKIDQRIEKLNNVLSDDSPSVICNTQNFSKISKMFFTEAFPEQFISLSDYIGFDLNFNQNKMLFSGLIFKPKDKLHLWTNFKNLKPSKSIVAEVIPSNFINAKSLLISDYQEFVNKENSVDKATTKDSLFLEIIEISEFNLPIGKGFALASANIDQTFDKLRPIALPQKKFGGYQVYQLDKKLYTDINFKNAIDLGDIRYFSVFQDIVVGAKQIDVLEDIVIQINNQNVLSEQENYKNHIKSLTDQSHMLWFSNLNRQEEYIDRYAQPTYKKQLKAIDWTSYSLAISQLIVEDNFAYFNILHKKTDLENNQDNVKQIVRLKSDTPILNSPQFFKNWRTGQYDVVYQDKNNVLHLKDTKGNLIWSKTLDSPIVGKINTIDIYKNTRLQLAFATQNKVYVLDKNANEVSPFPLKFKNRITQGLSVFDYDKNGRYRFVVVMGNKIRMYDKRGKRVRGFKFKKTKKPLQFPLKHIRIQKRDYILAQEESGQLHILSRTGKTRIDINNNLETTNHQWYEHKQKFVSVSDKGDLLQIGQNTKLTKLAKDWLNPKFNANSEMLVSMSENILHINSSVAELPYGLYSKPFIIDDFVGIADAQAQKIYVFDKNANLIKGFPVYGNSISDAYSLGDKVILMCQDTEEAILLYSINVN